MSPARLFVVVSTGQNVANLPPLLEHAEVGDRVLWIESAEARKRKWSEGARRVLGRYGLESLLPDDAAVEVKELDDLSALVAACRPAVEQARSEGLHPYLLLNGGPKLTPLGLLRAWGELNPVLLYGEERPALCKTFPGSLEEPAEVRPYTRHTLDLPDLLEVSGHQFFDSDGVKLWPGPLTEDLAREPYGQRELDTAQLHGLWHQYGQAVSPGESLVRYADLHGLVPKKLETWKLSLPALDGVAVRSMSNTGLFSNIYHATLNLAREAATARSRANLPVLMPLGPAFERAVARRVHAWLSAGQHPAVQSAWRGVKVSSRREPQRVLAEFDVLLVLKNGVLWHLECKSFTADTKDLDARLFNLQQAGSQLARMALCAPLFTDYVNEPWFTAQHDLRKQIEERRHLSFIPFTHIGQPTGYSVEELGVLRQFACPALEDALIPALGAYVLASSS